MNKFLLSLLFVVMFTNVYAQNELKRLEENLKEAKRS
jgi:hypothetical protein